MADIAIAATSGLTCGFQSHQLSFPQISQSQVILKESIDLLSITAILLRPYYVEQVYKT